MKLKPVIAQRKPWADVPRLVNVAVKNEAVDPLRPRSVADGFDGRRMLCPATFSGERFSSHDGVAVEFSDGRDEFWRVEKCDVAAPELAHHDVARRTDLHVVKGPPVRFYRQFHAMLMTQVAKMSVVIIRDHVADSPAEIPKKAFGDFSAVDVVTGQRRQERSAIVPATAFKLFLKTGCPVGRADLVTVDDAIGDHRSDQRSEFLDDGSDAALPIRVDRRAAHFVAFKSASAGGGWAIALPVGRVPDS